MTNDNIKIYLCGPINGCSDSECKDWREAIKTIFPNSIDPMKRDYRGKEKDSVREIVELDKRDVRNSDIILVNFIKPSVGTAMEILYAWEHEIPVILLCDPTMVLSPWLIYHSTSIVGNVKDAIAKINEII